jgi:hypothetical protein
MDSSVVFIYKKLIRIGNQFLATIESTIEEYRVDASKTESKLFRKGIEDGYSNSELSRMALFLLFTSLENTVIGISSLITELSLQRLYID